MTSNKKQKSQSALITQVDALASTQGEWPLMTLSLLNGTVLKRIIREAPKGEDETAPFDSEVYVHYELRRRIDGEKVDSSRDRNNQFHFTIGDQHVGNMWEALLPTMRRGEVAEIQCDANLVYPNHKRPPQLKAKEPVIVDVELYRWEVESSVIYNGQVKKHRLRKGEAFVMPSEGSKITVKYIGRLEDGTVFDDKSDGVTITLGLCDIIEGLEEGLKGMAQGEHSILHIYYSYAFGLEGDEQMAVPPKSQVFYDVELCAVENTTPKWELSISSKLKFGKFRHAQGNNLFKKKRFGRAMHRYKQALNHVQYEKVDGEEPELQTEVEELVCACENNIATLLMQKQFWDEVVNHCSRVLRLRPKNLKALFRRATALFSSAQADVALKDIEVALQEDPTNKVFLSMKAKAKAMLYKAEEIHRRRFGGWCDKGIDLGDDISKSRTNQKASLGAQRSRG